MVAVDEGLQETERGVSRWAQHSGKSPTPAASWFRKQDGNIRHEEIAKEKKKVPRPARGSAHGCRDMTAGRQRRLQRSAENEGQLRKASKGGSHSPGVSGRAQLPARLVLNNSKSPDSLPCRRERLIPALLHGDPARIPLPRPVEGSGH